MSSPLWFLGRKCVSAERLSFYHNPVIMNCARGGSVCPPIKLPLTSFHVVGMFVCLYCLQYDKSSVELQQLHTCLNEIVALWGSTWISALDSFPFLRVCKKYHKNLISLNIMIISSFTLCFSQQCLQTMCVLCPFLSEVAQSGVFASSQRSGQKR